MSTLQQLREGLSEAWDTLMEGWQRLYRRAAGAITRFTPTGKEEQGETRQEGQEIVARSSGWGLLAAEVFDDDDKVVVHLEAPGMDKNDFALQVRDDYLVVRGNKRFHRERSEGRYHVMECAYGRFERAVPLPDEVETDGAKATYDHGVLRVELPKSATRRRRSITIDVT